METMETMRRTFRPRAAEAEKRPSRTDPLRSGYRRESGRLTTRLDSGIMMLHDVITCNRGSIVLSGGAAVKVLAREHPDWLDVVRASYEEAGQSDRFAGAWVCQRLGRWVPSLRMLAAYGILEKVDTSRGGRRAYYRMPARQEVGKALRELGAL
jgi:hypothetical protein